MFKCVIIYCQTSLVRQKFLPIHKIFQIFRFEIETLKRYSFVYLLEDWVNHKLECEYQVFKRNTEDVII